MLFNFEEVVERTFVDGDLTFAGADAGAGDGGLAASGSQSVVESVAFDNYSISHNYLTFLIVYVKSNRALFGSQINQFRILRLMRVFRTNV